MASENGVIRFISNGFSQTHGGPEERPVDPLSSANVRHIPILSCGDEILETDEINETMFFGNGALGVFNQNSGV